MTAADDGDGFDEPEGHASAGASSSWPGGTTSSGATPFLVWLPTRETSQQIEANITVDLLVRA